MPLIEVKRGVMDSKPSVLKVIIDYQVWNQRDCKKKIDPMI